jgi:hypothetical protein
VRFEQLTTASGTPHQRRQELLRCWKETTEAGGAVGLPPGPASEDDVAALAKPL